MIWSTGCEHEARGATRDCLFWSAQVDKGLFVRFIL